MQWNIENQNKKIKRKAKDAIKQYPIGNDLLTRFGDRLQAKICHKAMEIVLMVVIQSMPEIHLAQEPVVTKTMNINQPNEIETNSHRRLIHVSFFLSIWTNWMPISTDKRKEKLMILIHFYNFFFFWNIKLKKILQQSLNDEDLEEVPPYALFPGYQQRDRQPLPAILPPHDDIYQDADESQPLTSESQQETPTHIPNQMMVTPAVSAFFVWYFHFIHIQDTIIG